MNKIKTYELVFNESSEVKSIQIGQESMYGKEYNFIKTEMNERLLKYRDVLSSWRAAGRNYVPSVDWVDLNSIAVDLGSSPFNLGCSSCRNDLALFISDVIKERGI